jgi:hypothetical protein
MTGSVDGFDVQRLILLVAVKAVDLRKTTKAMGLSEQLPAVNQQHPKKLRAEHLGNPTPPGS